MSIFLVTTLFDELFNGGDVDAETNDGTGLSLREAIGLANDAGGSNIINFDPALFNGTIFLSNGPLPFTGGVTVVSGDINGDGAPDIIVDGNDGSRVFQIFAGNVTLNGLGIQGGNAAYGGGGVRVDDGAIVKIINSIVTSNMSDNGGGVYNGGTLTIVNSTISNNQVGTVPANLNGGGIFNVGTLLLDSTLVQNNSSVGGGGGIFNGDSGTLTIINNTLISDNAAPNEFGGGIGNLGTLFIRQSTVENNSALSGGGIANRLDGEASLSFVSLLGNSATQSGGGLHNSGTVNLLVTEVEDNTAGSDGGGIFNTGLAAASDNLFRGNIAINGGGVFNNDGGFFQFQRSEVIGNSASQLGGGFFSSGQTVWRFVAVEENDAPFGGGGMFNDGIAWMISSLFSGNSALSGVGGGIYNGVPGSNYTGSPTLIMFNTTISGNRANFGGGIGNDGNAILLDNTTSGNFANSVGGGLLNGNAGGLTLGNSIVAGNDAGILGTDFFNNNLIDPPIFTGVNLFSQAGVGGPADIIQLDLTQIFDTVDFNPFTNILSGQLADLGGRLDTIAIILSGDAHNTGDAAALPADIFDLNFNLDVNELLPFDARGLPRVVGPNVDIGAIELIDPASALDIYWPRILQRDPLPGETDALIIQLDNNSINLNGALDMILGINGGGSPVASAVGESGALSTGDEVNEIVIPVLREYQAVYGRLADPGGLDFWTNVFRFYKDGGLDDPASPHIDEAMWELSKFFVNPAITPEFVARYGADPDTLTYVDLLYSNVLNRPSDPGGLDFWTGVLDQLLGQGMSKLDARALMLEQFVDSPEYANNIYPHAVSFLKQIAHTTTDFTGSLWDVVD